MAIVSLSPSTDDKDIATNASPTPTQLVPTATEDTQENADLQRLFVRATAQAQGGIPARIHAPSNILLRAEPKVDSTILGEQSNGTVVTALGQSDDGLWIKITHQDFLQAGWVFVVFVTLPKGSENLPIIDS